MKLAAHEACKRTYYYGGRLAGRQRGKRPTRTTAIYERSTENRSMVSIGAKCNVCGAVRLNDWPTDAWVMVK